MTNYSRSVLKSNGQIRGLKPPKESVIRKEKCSQKSCFSGAPTPFLHMAHKRRDVRFKGPWRVHTPSCPQNCTQRLTRANKGYYAEESRWAYLPTLLAVVRGKQGAFWTSTHALCVDVQRRRGPAGTRSPAAGSCAASVSFTVCHRCVEIQERAFTRRAVSPALPAPCFA